MSSEQDAVKSTLKAYFDGLNVSDAKKCSAQYAKDGIAMAQNFPTQEGIDNISEWYKNVFEAITLKVTLDIKEVVVTSPEYAFARTSTSGTQKINQTGDTSKEANQELFVLKKVDGDWKIAIYSFSTTNPA